MRPLISSQFACPRRTRVRLPPPETPVRSCPHVWRIDRSARCGSGCSRPLVVGTRPAMALALKVVLPGYGLRVCPLFDIPVLISPGLHRSPAPDPRSHHEAHLPAKRPEAGQEAWVPQPHVDPRRPRSSQEPSPQGPSQDRCLIRGISDRATFARLRANGTSVRSSHLRLRHLDDIAEDADLRVAYAIPRKVGSAVVRNRIRRRIRGLLDERRATGLPLPTGAMLFIVFPSARDLTHQDLREQVTDVLDKLEASKTLKKQGNEPS